MKIFFPFYSKPLNRHLMYLLLVFLTLGSSTLQAQPTFSKVFTPNRIGPGSVSTLTFTITNNAGTPVTALTFTDNLPTGVTIATPANASVSDVTGVLSAPDGGSTISFSGGRCGGGKALTISVDVTCSTVGAHTNPALTLSSSAGSSQSLPVDLTVVNTLPGFSKSFSPATINYGERTTLTFTIDNSANANRIANIDFTDNLPAGIVVANPANVTITNAGSALGAPVVTAVPGTGIIKYDADGSNFHPGFESLAAGMITTVSVDIIGNSAGNIVSVSEDLLADFTMCGKASAALEVRTPNEISIRKSFSSNPIPAGGTTNVEYTIENRSRRLAATNISFTDDLDVTLSGLVANGLPANSCEGTVSGTDVITYSGGTLAAGSSCTFSVPVDIPAGAAQGTYTSTTSAITANFADRSVTGNTASENLYIASVPTLTKRFLNSPVVAGDTATMEFTITNTDPNNALTDISFTDNLTDFLGFFPHVVHNWPEAGSCGGATFGFIFPDTDVQAIQMTGGSLAPEASSTFTIEIGIPIGHPSGIYTNTTSTISGVVDGMSVIGDPASADLEILGAPSLSMSFTDDPVEAGGSATLEFTVNYSGNATVNATDISFTLDLDAAIPGLVATGLPQNDICGTGSQLTGTNMLSLTGGNMSPGESYTFSVPVQIPPTAVPGSYNSTTSALSATIGGVSTSNNPASDKLDIAGLSFTAEFIDDPVIPSDLVTLRYTIDNTSTADATISSFTDDLGEVIPGLAAEAPLPVALCGAGASLSGTSFLIYTGGLVAAGTTCSFDVNCRVPAGAAPGDYSHIPSSLSATINGSDVSISPTSLDQLEVRESYIKLTKTFSNDPVVPGGTVTLEYTVTNLHPTEALSSVAFTDNFDFALTGLEATVLPASSCGGTASGTSLLDYSGGSIPAGESCTFSVTLQTPVGAPFGGSFESTTSAVSGEINGLAVTGEPAVDNLDFSSLQVSKAFTSSINAGATATLRYTLSNPDPINSVSNIRFTDDLDAMITGVSANNLPLNDVCGVGSSLSGTSLLLFNRGSLAANETKTFDVTIQIPCGVVAGDYTSTSGTITADGANGTYAIDPVSATLTIIDNFTPGEINGAGETICYNGDPVEIGSVTAASGGDENITYKWESSTDGFATAGTVIVGATAASYDPPAGLTSTTSYRRYANDGTCNTAFEASTGTWTVTVYNNYTSGAIDATGETICYGADPVEIGSVTAASGGDENITYKWESSTDGFATAGTVIGGATAASYDPPAGLTATTSYRRYAHDGTCNTAFEESTGTWTVTVYNDYTAGAINATGETICYGADPVEIGSVTAASGGDENITYKWESSTDGFNTAGTIIAGATAASYDPPVGLTATTSYRRYAHDETCSTSFTASTGTWTVTVYNNYTSGEIEATGETICYGADPVEIGSVTAASGGDENITYKWESSTDGFATAGTVIGGATAASYDPPAGLMSTTSYRRYANDETCNTSFTASTGTWTVTVYNNYTSGAIDATGETICYGADPVEIGSVTAASGGDENITYKWESSTDGFATAGSLIGGATAASYDPPAGLTATTSYRRYAHDGTCNTAFEVSTGIWTVTVYKDYTSGEIEATGETICYGADPVEIESVTAASGGDENITYKWEASTDGFATAGSLIVGATTASYDPPAGLTATTSYRRYAHDETCNTDFTASTGTWTVTVYKDFTSGEIEATGETICYGADPVEIGSVTAASGGDENITYKWESSTDGFATAGKLIVGATAASYDPPAGLTAITSYRRYANDGTCNTDFEASTGTWTVTVKDLPTAICKDITFYLDASGSATLTPSDIDDGSSSPCGIASMTLDITDFTCEDPGDHTVTLTISDPNGNSATCQSVISIVDSIAPTIITNAESVSVEIGIGECETKITYPTITANDNCEVSLERTAGLGAEALFPIGTTTETWLATDAQGNTSVFSFDVIVTVINDLPTINAVNDTVVLEDTRSIIVPLSGITAGNDCDEQELSIEVKVDNNDLVSHSSLNYTQGDTDGSINLEFFSDMNGETDVTITVSDSKNATVSETFKVTVTPVNDAPYLVETIEDQTVHTSAELVIPIPEAMGVLFDDLDDETLSYSITTVGADTIPSWATYNSGELLLNPSVSDTGCVIFTITATDAAGASASDTFEVCVRDNTVSIDDLESGVFDLKLFPNPTKGIVTIEPITEVSEDIEIAVMNIAGREVYRETFRNGNPIRFDMSEHVSGMYMVMVKTGNHSAVKKLILDRK